MLIRSKRSKKSQQANWEREHSTEGKHRAKDAENLQATVQGELSYMVRKSPNGILDDEQVGSWLQMQKKRNKSFRTYSVMRIPLRSKAVSKKL